MIPKMFKLKIFKDAAIVLVACMLLSNISYATDISVTSGAVDDTINGNCSLIEAIRSANTDSVVGADACPAGSGSDQLDLGGATYSLTVVNDTNYGYNATPCITSEISIIGGGAIITRSSTSADFRLICVADTGHLEIEDTTITNGKADGPSLSYQRGGAILVRGILDLDNVVLNGNTAAQQGGALLVDGGTANISNSTFEGNSAVKGGAIRSDYNESNDSTALVNIVSSVFNNNQADHGGATFFSNSVANVNNSVISNNSSVSVGGGLYYSGSSGSIISSSVNGNITGEKGAGIRIDRSFPALISSNVTISNSIIDGNHAINYGGGGIYVILSNLTLEKTTISNNIAGSNNPDIGRGGGLYVDVAHADVQNTTLSGNSAVVYGGGIYVDPDPDKALYNASITLKHVTVSSNSAIKGGEGIWLNPISKATLVNSIVAKNGSDDCGKAPTALMQDDGGNWFGDNRCTGVANGEPKLGPLSDNGGPTYTHALLTGSPAIDQGVLSDCLPTDQRGETRPIGSSCEPGAYEEFCSFSILPTSYSFSSNEGSETVNITASRSDCAWNALENLYWISLSPTSGTDDGIVTVTVSANNGGPRSGAATIAGQRYSINQAAVDGWVPPGFSWIMFLPAIINNK